MESLQLCTLPDSIEHQLWIYFIPWECHGSYVFVLQISIVFSLSLRPQLCDISCICIDRLQYFWALIPLFILLTLLRAWVFPPRPYTCHALYVSHPFFRTHNKKTKSHRSSNKEAPLLCGSLQSLHYCHHYSHDPMMFIGHMMRSFPHTSRGNLLTQKKCSPSST